MTTECPARPLRVVTRALAATLALTLTAALAPDARADWYEDFDAGFAQAWSFLALDDVGDPPSTGVSEFAIIEAGADDYLRMSHTTTGFPDGGGGATDAIGIVSGVFTDVFVTAELNVAPADGQQSVLAVIARGNPVTGTAYIAGVDFTNSFFAIARSDDLGFFIVPIAIDSAVVIDPNESYRVAFGLVGSNMAAQLFDESGANVSTIGTVDGLYTSGVSGVLVETAYNGFNPIGPIVGTFDDVEAVPEPSGGVALTAGAALLTLLARARIRRARPFGAPHGARRRAH